MKHPVFYWVTFLSFILHFEQGFSNVKYQWGLRKQIPSQGFAFASQIDEFNPPKQKEFTPSAFPRQIDEFNSPKQKVFIPSPFPTPIDEFDPPKQKRFIPSPSTIIKTIGSGLDKIFLKHLEALDSLLNSKLLTQFVPGNGQIIPIPKIPLLPDLSVLKQLFKAGHESVKSSAVCTACRIGFAYFLLKARAGILYNEVKRLTIIGCHIFRIASPDVCEGLVQNYAPILYHIGTEKTSLSPDEFCGIALQSFGCIATDWKSNEWSISPLIAEFPDPTEDSTNFRSDFSYLEGEELPLVKILHLADLHVDPDYIPGANAVCGDELCCRSTNGMAENGKDGGGIFGDLRACDLPWNTLESAFQHISATHPDIRMIYMTGDLIPHNVWSTNIETNTQIITNITSLLKSYFPRTQIIPVIGNHESHPANVFAPFGVPAELSTRWLYELTSDLWSEWIPAGEAKKTFKKAGFYEIPIAPNFRIIVLNTNLCYGFNFWHLLEFKDPANQLEWLIEALQGARERGDKVHIVGHISPGQEDCTSTWSQSFYDIINKFSDVIASQFYGHTHYDEFQLFYHKDKPTQPISPAWFGPGLSPFTQMNPGYKIYYVDGARGQASSWNVLDAETWILNLTKANEDKVPKWERLYKTTEAYGIPDLLPNTLHELVQSFSTNKTMFDKYYRFYYKDTPESTSKPCGSICQKRLLCNIVTPFYERQVECMALETEVDGIVLPKRIFEKLRTVALGPVVKVADKFKSIFGLG